MSNRNPYEVTFMQFIFLINGAQVGAGVLSLPKHLAETGGTDGWMALIVGWVLNLAASLLIVQVFKKFPDCTLYELLVRLFGKWAAKILLLPLLIYFLAFAWNVLISAMLYVKAWFLPRTPDYLIMALFALPTYMIIRNGWKALGRYSEFVFYFTSWMPFILLLTLQDSHWVHLLPLFKDGLVPIAGSIESTIISMIGFEITFFLYPYLKNKRLATRGIVIANSITALIYIYITVICFVFFSPDEITRYNQPVLSLLKVIEFRFLERFDMIFLALYLFVVSTAWMPYAFCACFCANKLLPRVKISHFAGGSIMLFVALVIALHPSWNQSETWTKLLSRWGIAFAYLFPFALWIYVQVYLRVRRERTT